jgi:hypothetical protein
LPPTAVNRAERGYSMKVLSNMMNWDPVLWMSILMVVAAIVIVVFLAVKVKLLMSRDAEAHKRTK